MANEFIIKNGFFSQGNSTITGSLNVTAGITGSIEGTATSASYALTASFAQNGNGIFSGSFSGSYEGDGSQLTGIVANTDFTQSLFVTPSGDDGTAVVGDMLKPFQTILAATASANPGDTIIVYPGVYFPTSQILKDYVNYYFYPGAIVSGSFQLMSGTYEKVNIRGAGKFETVYNGAPVGFTANGYFECDTVEFAGLQSSGYAGSPSFAQNSTADANGILELKGNYVYGLKNGARAGNSFNAAINFGAGNIIAHVNAFVSSSSQMQGIRIASDNADLRFYGNVYASNGHALQTNNRVGHCTLRGKFETGDQANYRALYIYPAYIGRFIIDAEILGSIYIDTGEEADSGVIIRGFQSVGSSPDGAAVTINGGYNVLSHTIRASEIIFNQTGPAITHFDGAAFVSSNQTGKLFDIDSGTFVWNGLNAGTNVRALSNVVSGGELIINGPLEHYGSSYPNNTYCFSLSGGTLELNNKIIYHQNTTGSGIVNMSGGYLKMNAAQLIHFDETGSYAAAVNLNNSDHSGSILNNSFTNLTPFINTGTFTNEIIGGGTLFYSDKIY